MNMKPLTKTKWAAALLLAAMLLAGSWPARAQIVTTPITPLPFNAISETAGSTFLVPYFEVDLSNPNGRNTIFTINKGGRLDSITVNGGPPSLNNNIATAVLAHVTIWSDLGVPVLNFNVYLTGYDVETVNMRNVLAGTLPRTASAGQDPTDTISPKGIKSQDINFASCNGQLPPAPLTATQISNLDAALTGNAAPTQCAGRNLSDNVARGYVTVDMVNNCSTKNPGDAGYFTNDTTLQNHLTGEVYYVDPSNSIARGGNVVHIHGPENGVTDPLVTTSGNYTFYGRLDGFNADDKKEPLSTLFVARFNPGGTPNSWRVPPPNPKASLIVWRDPKVPQGFFTCGTLPVWYPLGQENITAFDEQEHPQTITGVTPFPAATQLVQIGGAALPVSFASGMILLNLNTTVAGAVGPTSDLGVAQGWVQVIDGKFGVIHNAQQLDSATKPAHLIP
ncbi:MAG TPA: hypothetical protein VHE60_13960 [Pyrinomonadaceae bacterium]|nr:hypothetical protein [Pyrinomonadaceae bacterium]